MRQQESETFREYNRPRRPEANTIAYLRSLPLDVQIAENEIQGLQRDPETNEYPSTLSAALSALDEIRNEVASLSGDEHAAEVLEQMIRITVPHSQAAARVWLSSTKGYTVFLATHRYGSHVLQTLLQQICHCTGEDLGVHNDSPLSSQNDDESLIDLLIAFQAEISPHLVDLAVHVCGSHVLRSLICVLAGVVEINHKGNPLRRGKAKKKKKKANPERTQESKSVTRLQLLAKTPVSPRDERVMEALNSFTNALTGTNVEAPGDLQDLACQPSGAILDILLRALTYRDCDREKWIPIFHRWEETDKLDHHLGMARPEPKFEFDSEAHRLTTRILSWEAANKFEHVREVIYGLAGDVSGSRLLETILLLCPDRFYDNILVHGDFKSSKTLQDYAKHHVGHFVIETLLATSRSDSQAKQLIENLEPLVANGVVLDANAKLRSILWRMVEAATRHQVCQEHLLMMLRKGCSALKGQTSMNARAVVPMLLDAKKPEKDGERLSLNVAGTRCVHSLLRFQPALSKPIVEGVVELPQDILELIIKDGLGSRCIADGLIEGNVAEKVFASALAKLVVKLSDRWVALSTDRIGHHAVKKLSGSLTDHKAQDLLVKELLRGKKRLSGVSMGRSVLDAWMVHDFEMKGEKEWRRLLASKREKSDWFNDLGKDSFSPKRLSAQDRSNKKKKQKKMDVGDIMSTIHM